MKTHYLKTWTTYFEEVQLDNKRFELRKNDRDFKVGDILVLQEYDPNKEIYTGCQITRKITYLLEDEIMFGLKEGFVIMSLSKL